MKYLKKYSIRKTYISEEISQIYTEEEIINMQLEKFKQILNSEDNSLKLYVDSEKVYDYFLNLELAKEEQ